MSAPLVLVANARMPSQRAQSLQVAQMAAAFERAGAPTTLVHALRRDTPAVDDPDSLWDHYAVPEGARPGVEGVSCVDWIDCVPRALQYIPARLQELSFARRAARAVERGHEGARALCREVETAHALGRRAGVFLEIHRVPGGRARRRWLCEAAARAAGTVAISSGVRDDLVELGLDGSKILVEHDGFEPERFQGLPDKADAREELGLDPARPTIVYSGGLLGWKGVDVLVEAARGLEGVCVVIAGGMDADVAELKRRAAGIENVRIDGFQPPGRVGLYLAAADLGVVPNRSSPPISSHYTSPLKVFESMAVGLPLVCSDLPSLRDVLGEDEAYFVPPDDPAELREGLRRALTDEAGRRDRAERLRTRARAHSWGARARRILDWMEARG